MNAASSLLLPAADFLRAVELGPLVSIDLIVRDAQGRMLLGYRRNRPARHYWFVPGGRVCKNETLDAAFRRISAAELGQGFERAQARALGVFEHFYADNFADHPNIGTHYVVLAHSLLLTTGTRLTLPPAQHQDYLWLSDAELAQRADVHPNSRAYAGL